VEQGGGAEVGAEALQPPWPRRRARSTTAISPNRFFVVSSYLSTATVLYKRGGFDAEDIAKLREHQRAMSFDEITTSRLRIRRIPDRQGVGGLPAPEIFFEGGSQSRPMEESTPEGRRRRRHRPAIPLLQRKARRCRRP